MKDTGMAGMDTVESTDGHDGLMESGQVVGVMVDLHVQVNG
jgi:hypothetical protein